MREVSYYATLDQAYKAAKVLRKKKSKQDQTLAINTLMHLYKYVDLPNEFMALNEAQAQQIGTEAASELEAAFDQARRQDRAGNFCDEDWNQLLNDTAGIWKELAAAHALKVDYLAAYRISQAMMLTQALVEQVKEAGLIDDEMASDAEVNAAILAELDDNAGVLAPAWLDACAKVGIGPQHAKAALNRLKEANRT